MNIQSNSTLQKQVKASKKKLPAYYVDGGTSRNGDFGNQNSFICGTDSRGKELFFEQIGDKTSNEAELLAIIEILKSTKGDIHIICDSQLAVNLVQHRYHTKIDRLRNLLMEIQSCKRIFKITWKRRDQNKAGWLIEKRLGL